MVAKMDLEPEAEVSRCTKVPLAYWRAALAEAALPHIQVPEGQRPIQLGCERGVWKIAAAEPTLSEWIDIKFAESKHVHEIRRGEEIKRRLPLLLIPARLVPGYLHGASTTTLEGNAALTPLCIPVLLNEDGSIEVDSMRTTWIPRELLTPTHHPLMIGKIEEQDKLLSRLPTKHGNLDQVFAHAAELLFKVTGASLSSLQSLIRSDGKKIPEELAAGGFQTVPEWFGLAYDPPVVAIHLLNLYNSIEATKPEVPLLETLRSTVDKPTRPPSRQVVNALEQVGHIDPTHGLTVSQREAVLELTVTPDGQVLAVNGPPGTGKTTLLQSVVAQLRVHAAIHDQPCPIILVSSTNNQAVENVLSSFAKLPAQDRWHLFEGGFGLFLTNGSRGENYPKRTSSSHPFHEVESDAKVKEILERYVSLGAEAFNLDKPTLEQVVKACRMQLAELKRELHALLVPRAELMTVLDQDEEGAAGTGIDQACERLDEQMQEPRNAIAHSEGVLERCTRELEEMAVTHPAEFQPLEDAESRWAEYISNSSLWQDLFSFIPAVKRRRDARDILQIRQLKLHGINQVQAREQIASFFAQARKQIDDRQQMSLANIQALRERANSIKAEALRTLEPLNKAREDLRSALGTWLEASSHLPLKIRDGSFSDLNNYLDTDIRARMFVWADRYWIGKWLQEVLERLRNPPTTKEKSPAKLEATFRRFAKITPVMVASFHSAPRFFTGYPTQTLTQPLFNCIDLLIVDEAGQVSPEIGAPVFALAKRALVVGDTFQIEPVYSVGRTTDRQNAATFKLTATANDPAYAEFDELRVVCANGNLMHIANRACLVQKFEHTRGLMLTEHFRCVPEIISYCNELVYKGALQLRRSSIATADQLFKPFQFQPVNGKDQPSGTSRINDEEARAIVDWLATNQVLIEQHYSTSGSEKQLGDLVAVITPFTVQSSCIKRHLQKRFGKTVNVVVGTVNAMQGAERPIVLFSTTYGANHDSDMFFMNRAPNLLNVAVSRAKDSFIVFGNAKHYQKGSSHSPARMLGRYLSL